MFTLFKYFSLKSSQNYFIRDWTKKQFSYFKADTLSKASDLFLLKIYYLEEIIPGLEIFY